MMDLSSHRNAGSPAVARLAAILNKPIIIFTMTLIGFISLAEISESIVGSRTTHSSSSYSNLRNGNSKYQYSNNHNNNNNSSSSYNYNHVNDPNSNADIATDINDASGDGAVGNNIPSSSTTTTNINNNNNMNKSFLAYLLTVTFFVMLLMLVRRLLMYCILRRALTNRATSVMNGNTTNNRNNDILQRMSSNLLFPMSFSFNTNNINRGNQQVEMALNRLRSNPRMQGFLGSGRSNEDRIAMQRFLANIVGGDDENLINGGASDVQINRLPLHTYHDTTTTNNINTNNDNMDENNSYNNSNSNDDNHNSCAVCLCPFEEGDLIRTTPCMHMFHQKCVDQWLQQRSICPVCKYSVIA